MCFIMSDACRTGFWLLKNQLGCYLVFNSTVIFLLLISFLLLLFFLPCTISTCGCWLAVRLLLGLAGRLFLAGCKVR